MQGNSLRLEGGNGNQRPQSRRVRERQRGPWTCSGSLKRSRQCQLSKQFRNKLGLALQAVTESGEGGIALSDVKKFVDATVMQSNEYLGVLSRLDLVFKKKDKVGAKYFRSRYRKTK